MDGKKPGKNLSDIQEINRALVLKNLRNNPNCSRSQIARNTGLQQATITKIVNDFIDSGIVIETKLLKNERGRRSIGLALNAEHYMVIGVRLTRSHIYVGLYDIAGKEYNLIRESINISEGAEEAIKRMNRVIHYMLDTAGNEYILGIGVGLPGPFLKEEGIIAVMADFPGWEGYSIRLGLEEEFGKIIYTVHDAYANGLAEWWFGNKREESKILLSVSMEEGLGAGLINNGKIYYGTQGIAGEIGHISIDYQGLPCVCGNRGCLRNYCTKAAVVRQAMEGLEQHPESALNRLPDIRLESIVQAALEGDTFSADLIRQAGTFLGYGLINAIYAYNPDMIVLSREFAQAGDLYLNAVKEVLQARLLPIIYNELRIEFSKLTHDPVLMGAVALVTDFIFMNPSYIVKLGDGQKKKQASETTEKVSSIM